MWQIDEDNEEEENADDKDERHVESKHKTFM